MFNRLLMCVLVLTAAALGGRASAVEAAAPPKVEAAVAADPLPGVYSGEHQGNRLKMTIRARASGGYEGDLVAGDERFAFTAAAEKGAGGPGMRGEAHEVGTGHEKFDFSAVLANGVLTLDDTATKIKLTREGDVPAAAAAGPTTLEGDWEARFEGQIAKVTFKKDGETYKGTLTMADQKYEMELKVEGDRVSGSALNPRGEREELNGTLANGELTFIEKNDRITFTRPGAGLPSTLEGMWGATIEGKQARMIVRAAGLDKYDVETRFEDRKSSGKLTVKGRELSLVMQKPNGDESTLEGEIRGDRLVVKEHGKEFEFKRVTVPEAPSEFKMPSGITLTLPDGWSVKPGDSFTIVSVGEGEGDVRIFLEDGKIGERTQEAFVKSFVEFAEVFFLKPVGDLPPAGEDKVKIRFAGERKDGVKIIGYAGIETREKIALGAMIFGPEADVERALEKAEKLLRSAKWPGEAALKVEMVPGTPDDARRAPEAVPPAAPAPPPGPSWSKVELEGFEFAAPPKWEVDPEKTMASLTPPEDEDTVAVVLSQSAAAGVTDPLGAAMRRRATEMAGEVHGEARPAGEPRVMTIAGAKAALYSFEYTPAANAGEDDPAVRVLIGAVVSGDSVYLMVAHGEKDDVRKHAHDLERVLQSIKPKAGAR